MEKKPDVGKQDNLFEIKLRQNFYRDGWRIMIVSIPILVVTLLLSISLNFWLAQHQPDPRFFATNNGLLYEMKPMDQPFLNDADMLQWVATAVRRSYQYDFTNYRDQFETFREFFTDEALAQYKKSVAESRLPLILKKKLVSSAVLTSTPVIVGRTVVDGVMLFKFEVPVKITLINRTESLTGDYVISIIASRVPFEQSPYGIKIVQLNEFRTS